MSQTSFLLEVCVDTAAGVRAAMAGGADRIELCDALSVGGLTPSAGLMRLARKLGATTRAMIRPRAGDFIYSHDEIAVMLHDMELVADTGLEGVVLGASLASGELDVAALELLAGHAKSLDLKLALHRAFDLAPDPAAALDTAINLGFDTVLTSGGARSAPLGISGLTALVEQAAGNIEILAGSGVTTANLDDILSSGVRAVHASCSATVPVRSPRAAELGYVSPDLRDTDAAIVAQMRAAIDIHSESPISGSMAHVVC